MQAIRHLLAQRHFAVLICAAALLLKLLVPAGYMVAGDQGRLTITICSGTVPRTMTMDMPGVHGDPTAHGSSKDHGPMEEHGKAEMPCVFTGLSATATGAIDPIQFAALIAFILAIGLARARPPSLATPSHLRPPLRGPPTRL